MIDQDQHFMQLALRLAGRQLGKVAPNPAVGCILVQNGLEIGRGVTQKNGRPHAEIMALENVKQRGLNAKGATAYVTLEPCAHEGETKACTDALIKAEIAKIFIACKDPDIRVNGKGYAALKNAGIETILGIGEKEAMRQHQGFFLTRTQNRPFIAYKMATSLDGKIALANGKSQWITGELARRHGNFLRSFYDAILVGAGTLRADNPMLNCRIAGLDSPTPIIMAGNGALPLDATLFNRNAPLILAYPETRKLDKKLMDNDFIQKLPLAHKDGRLDISSFVQKLAQNGITRLLLEGGAELATAFLKQKLIDQIYHYQSSNLIGADGLPAIGDLAMVKMQEIIGFSTDHQQPLAQDHLRIMRIFSMDS